MKFFCYEKCDVAGWIITHAHAHAHTHTHHTHTHTHTHMHAHTINKKTQHPLYKQLKTAQRKKVKYLFKEWMHLVNE